LVLLSAVFALLQISGPAGVIAGTVRDDPAERVLAGVTVIEDGRVAAITDSLGHYAISGLASGSHRLRFTSPGYSALDLNVVLADVSSITTVDVQLAALPLRLPTLQATADSAAPETGQQVAEIGQVTLDRDWADRSQAGATDPNRVLADAPGVQGAGENVAGLHVRGGATSHNLVLLNGIPLYSAVHYSAASSAVMPEAIGGATLHTGVSSARFGEHLAGVLELETPDPVAVPDGARGSLGSADLRQLVLGDVPAVRTGILLGGRTTYRDLLGGEEEADGGNGYHDLLGVATSRLAGGRLRVLSFFADNRLDFPSLSDLSGDGAGVRAPGEDGGEDLGGPRNAISWTSHSQGLTWDRTEGNGARVETAVWWAGSSADVRWFSNAGGDRVRSDLSELGLSAQASWSRADGGIGIGASLTRPSTRYTIASAISDSATPGLLALAAAPAVGSIFAERVWEPSRRVQVSLGLRASTDFARWATVEPRLTAMVRPDVATQFGIGLGRSHQVVQSAVNDASALGTLVGFDLPIAAGSGSLPLARADQLEATAARRITSGLDLSLTGYHWRSSGLVLGAASTRGLFPTDSIAVGEGSASGLTGAVELDRGNLSGRASVTVARDERTTAEGTSYDASYGHGTSISLDLGYRLMGATRLLLRYQGGGPQPTSVVAPGFEWRPMESPGERAEIAGTPENLPGTVNGARLPDYARLDLGVRRSWRIPQLGGGTLLTTSLSVINLLGRENVLGLVARPDGSLGVLPGARRALALEVGWQF
jgi:hypothetical protein